jgi:anaerobic magnesium-protoporphyrin IX monomethyl ester cyclase
MDITLIALGDRVENYTFRLFKALLEKNGYQVTLIYLNIGHLTSSNKLDDDLKAQLQELIRSAKLVGIYVFTFNFYLAVEISEHIHSISEALVVWGGPHAIAEPEECAQFADIVCFNEGEEAIIEISSRLVKKGKSFDRGGIPNIAYRMGDTVMFHPYKRLTVSLDTLPFPDFSFKRTYYVNEHNQIVPLTFELLIKSDSDKFCYITMISRGCPFRCAFCLNSNDNHIPFYLGRSVKNVIDELKYVKQIGGGHIWEIMFYDDNLFALPIAFIKEFTHAYKEQIGLPIHFVNAAPGTFNEEKLQLLKSAGVKGIVVGIQTISKNGRAVYGNPATKENISEIVKVMLNYPDMQLIFHLIFGNPYEDKHDIAENLLFLNSLPKIFEVNNYQLTIYPGTKLYYKVKSDLRFQHRAKEGYQLPYYYSRPELRMWNLLMANYLSKKKEFPGYITKLLEMRQYSVLKGIIFLQHACGYIKKHGIVFTFLKAVRKLFCKIPRLAY